MTGTDIPRDAGGRVLRPRPSQLLADVMDKLGPDHLTTRTLMAALIERDRGAGVEPRAVTPVFGWHVPVLSDAPNVPFDMQESSLDIEATVTAAASTASASAGWTVASAHRVWKHARMVTVTGQFTPTVSIDLATERTMATLPAGLRPIVTVTVPGLISSATQCRVQIKTTGEITVLAAYVMPTNLAVQFTATYAAA